MPCQGVPDKRSNRIVVEPLPPGYQIDSKEQEQKTIPAEEIEGNDILLIRPGERLPVDGVIVGGHSVVDESMLTGESIPVTKKEGDTVIGGTLNKNGVLSVRATEVGADTTLSRIVRLVQEAQGSKAAIAGMADRISLYFVPVVMVIAVLTGLAWYFIGNVDFSTALRFFIAVMVIACPCALGLATPTAIMVGSGVGLNRGILFKRASVLENISKVDILLFDKTGTITKGQPEVVGIYPFSGITENNLLEIAAGAEQNSLHPLAQSVVKKAHEMGLSVTKNNRGAGNQRTGHSMQL